MRLTQSIKELCKDEDAHEGIKNPIPSLELKIVDHVLYHIRTMRVDTLSFNLNSKHTRLKRG